jgi:hypothetical protein
VDCSVDTNLCVDRDEYVFWNMVHGTQAAYRWAFLAFFYGTTREAAHQPPPVAPGAVLHVMALVLK